MYTPEKIAYELDDMMIISERVRVCLIKSLSYLPEKVVDFVIENCTFICLEEKDKGIHIDTNDFRFKNKRGLIILSDKLWSKEIKEIAFVIAHEVAHAYKNHGFKSFNDTDVTLNKKREKAADKQAILWLRSQFTGSFKKYEYKDWQLS